MAITNYGELKTAIASWLDRTDLEGKIPNFITLGELALFRQLRCPGNEVTARYSTEATPPFTNNEFIELPNDFLEAKLVTYGDYPLTPVSANKFSELRTSSRSAYIGADNTGLLPRVGVPTHYARIEGNLYFYPEADANADVVMYYYQAQGPMVADSDTTRALEFAPDLYLFSALLQAQAYLIGDERLAVWGNQYQVAMDMLNEQVNDELYAGGTVTVNNIYEM